MSFLAAPVDANNVPIAEVYPPGSTGAIVALQGSTNTTTDAAGNTSAPPNFNLTQVNSLAVQMAGSDAMTASHILVLVPGVYNGSTADMIRSVGVGDGASTGLGAYGPFLYNGTNFDRQRANLDNITVLASAARTTTQTQADQTNYNHRGIVVVLDMTTVGTGNVTLEIDGKDPVSGKYYAILTGAAVNTNSTNVYTIYPGNAVTTNVSASTVLPRTWRIKVTANNSNSCTYSVGAMLIV